jgi:dihydropteroate synthase
LDQKPKYINVRGRLLDLTTPKVMGIINVTPDSFFAGSRVSGQHEILDMAAKMVDEGADLLDIGGFSSRPYADEVSPEEEKDRLLPAVKIIRKEFPDLIISVDTFRSEVARSAVHEGGADIINDISGGDADENMFRTVSELKVPYIMMHMQGTPSNMQDHPVYDDVVADILKWFGNRIYKLRSMGENDIIIDPGLGFGKTIDHNFEIIRRLHDFEAAGLPLMVGVSRKSMIWKTLGISPAEALNGTTVLNAAALIGGADIIRVHDVKEAGETVRLIGRMMDIMPR